MGKFSTQCLFHGSWIATVTYLMATSSFRNSETVLGLECIENHINIVFHVICFTIIGISFIGIVFIQNEATHIICALMVSIPLGLLAPGMTGYALYTIRTGPPYNVSKIRQVVVNRWYSPVKVVPILDAIQRTHGCCGLDGPTDYREYIYSETFCRTSPNDIPASCINLVTLYRKCLNKRYPKDNEFCFAYNFTENVIVFKDDAKNQQMNSMMGASRWKYKCDFVNFKDSTVNETRKPEDAVIYKQGCTNYIIGTCQSLRDSHYFFLFVMALVSWSLVILFLSNWFDAVSKVRKQIQLREKSPSRQFATIGYIVD